MKKPMNLLLLLMMLTTSFAFAAPGDKEPAPAAEAYKPKATQLHRADFDALIASPEKILVIDLRRPDEVSSIGGFPVYLSIQADQLEKSLSFIPKDRSIVTVSNHSGRSGKAADVLASNGFTVAGYLGAQYYEQEGGQLTKVAIPAPKAAAPK
jgi:rhodanese-related sulfurtransferase